MGQEIERKFLVDSTHYRPSAPGMELLQGYVAQGGMTVRVRLAGEKAFLTLKGPTRGISRGEYEYPIPPEEAKEMLALYSMTPSVHKTRYVEHFGGKLWEVDIFAGANAGLAVAEIELSSENEAFDLPPWITREVSGDPRYRNSSLAKHPFSEWKER